jgi:hypothetical protein
MQEVAESRGGKCLSHTYVNSKTKLIWECSKGHRWEAAPNNIRTGTWCPSCAGKKKLTIHDMKKIAESRGGQCLSETYKDGKTKLLWQCSKGHRWETIPNNIKRGSWCPACAGLLKGTLEEMQEIARRRAGKCLSETYINNRRKLLWECANGHRWEASPVKIKNGQWCPTCSAGLGERICKEFFEQIFGEKFPKDYPEWLVNSRGNRMELNGYSPKLKLAFEHHGQQHYKPRTQFIRSKAELQTRQKDDEIKRELCEQREIALIEIAEVPTLTQIDELKDYIKTECEKKCVVLPDNFDSIEVDLRNAYANFGLKEALKELQTLAKKRGGKCLSDKYIHSHKKLLWECAEGHQWGATPTNIKTGTWCPECAGKAKLTIEKLRKNAESRGGKCLSDTYVDNKTKLLWECSKGHQWETTAHEIRSGHWCPICAGKRKLTIEEMRLLGAGRGGECLSNEYVNANTKLLWKCSKGHRWEAIPQKIRQGQWCPTCAGRRKTIDDMRKIAKSRGGKCLSDKYINSKTKLLWECSGGHQWSAIPSNVQRGSWCPTCRLSEGIKKRELKKKTNKNYRPR